MVDRTAGEEIRANLELNDKTQKQGQMKKLMEQMKGLLNFLNKMICKMTWKDYLKRITKNKKYKGEWTETPPAYNGVATEERIFSSIKIDESQTFFNHAMNEKCCYVYGFVLKVAKYQDKYFFASEIYYGDYFCSKSIRVDIDFELIKNLKLKAPKFAFETDPNISIKELKEKIVAFANEFAHEQVKNSSIDLHQYAHQAVQKFAEAI